MTYATQQNIIDLYGQERLDLIADLDGNGVADPQAVTDALVEATSEIDSHLSARYSLPISSVPQILITFCRDIAMYRLATTAEALTDELRQRYEDAIAHLKRIADGKAGLGIAEPSAPEANSQTILTSGPDRLFSRDSLKGM